MAAPQDTDITQWLATVHLEQYATTFQRHGLVTAAAARGLGHEELRQLGISATGHRKRILRLLQASAAKGVPDPQLDNTMEPDTPTSAPPAQTAKPVPRPRTVFTGLSGPTTSQRPGWNSAFWRPEASRSLESSLASTPNSSASELPSTPKTLEMLPNALYFGLDSRARTQTPQDT